METKKKFVAIKTTDELTPKNIQDLTNKLADLSDEFDFTLVQARIKLHN